jgi:uncharacterized protein (DUF983 family)
MTDLPPISWLRVIAFFGMIAIGTFLVIMLGDAMAFPAWLTLIVWSFMLSGVIAGFIAASPIRGD